MVRENWLLQSRARSHIFLLVKFFDNEEYVTDFIDGRLYANRLSFSKSLEEGRGINRGDQNEGTIVWGRPGKVKVQINGHDLSNDLAGPARLSSNRLDAFNVLCLYAGYMRDDRHTNTIDIAKLRSQLLIPQECDKLGPYAVAIKNGPEFLNRVNRAAT